MTWWEAVPALLVAVLVGIGPGLAIGVALGLRGITLAGLAPAFSLSTIAIASVISPLLGIRWGIMPVIGATIILALGVGAFRYFWFRYRPSPESVQDPPRLRAWWAVGLAVGAVIIGIRFMIIFQSPDHISQTYDSIFHLNALRYILDGGDASSLTLGGLYRGSGTFYPAVWHAFASLVIEVGASMPVAVNAVNIVIGALFWPLGGLLLARQITGYRPLAIVAAGVLSAAFAVFPYLMIEYGVLYPYLLAVSLLPAALSVVIVAAGVGRHPTFHGPAVWIALLGVLPGIVLAHPSVVMGLLALSVPIMLAVVYRQVRGLQARRAAFGRTVIVLGAWGLAFLVMAVLWLALGVTTWWGPRVSTAHAFGELALNAPFDLPIAWAVSILIVIGLAVVVRGRARLWLALVFAMGAFLFLVATGFPSGYFRSGIVGIWYSDPKRLGALLPVVDLPLATLGFVWVHDRVRRWRRDGGARVGSRRSRAVSLALLAVLLLTTQVSNVNAEAAKAARNYTSNAHSNLLTPDERTLLDRVDRIVPPGVVVAGNPWTGTSLVYALANRQALLPHVAGFATPQTDVLSAHLDDALVDPTVCPAVRALKVGYVLDFGKQEVHYERHPYPGFDDLATSGAVTLVDKQGPAELYKITACG